MLGYGVTNMSHKGVARFPLVMQHTLCNTTRDILYPKSQHQHMSSSCRRAIVSPAAAAAAAQRHSCRSSNATLSPSSSSSSSGLAIELRRTLLMQQLQDVLPSTNDLDMPSDNLPPSSSSSSGAQRQERISKSAKGFGTGASSSSSRRKQQHGRQQQQQQRIEANDVCPCRSGLKHKDCCQPFLTGVARPRSALELVSARYTAARTGNVQYLVSTTHPDSSLTLGGARDLAGRAKRLCAHFRKNKIEIAGIAHCPGDDPGTWVVLTILEANSGEFAGEKIPNMELIARKSWTDTKVINNSYNKGLWSDNGAAAGSSEVSAGSQEWMYVGNLNDFPENGQAEVLVKLVQRHCPEVLNDGSSDGDQQQQQQGLSEREDYFVWTAPNFHVGWARSSSSSSSSIKHSYGSSSSSSNNTPDDSSSGSGSGSGRWIVDLLRFPSVESWQQQQQQAPISEDEDRQMTGQHHLLVPPGVFVMDNHVKQNGNMWGSC